MRTSLRWTLISTQKARATLSKQNQLVAVMKELACWTWQVMRVICLGMPMSLIGQFLERKLVPYTPQPVAKAHDPDCLFRAKIEQGLPSTIHHGIRTLLLNAKKFSHQPQTVQWSGAQYLLPTTWPDEHDPATGFRWKPVLGECRYVDEDWLRPKRPTLMGSFK